VVAIAGDKITQKTYTIEVIRGEVISGVEECSEEPLTVYPNPAGDYFTVGGLHGVGILTVSDIAGRQWIRQNIASSQETISVNALPPGIYFVHVIEGKKERNIKIIVE